MANNTHHNGLMNEQYIAVYPSLAKRCGINKAAILQKVHWKVESTKGAGFEKKHFKGRDGIMRWWYRASYTKWQKEEFTWLSKGTVQRLFLELEADGIIIVWTPEDNNQDKYYSIRYEAWEYWMKGHSVKPITNCDWWPILNLSQNEVGPITKYDGGDHKLWLAPITNCGGPYIYKDLKHSLNKNHQSSTGAPAPDAPTPIVEDDDEKSKSENDVAPESLTQLFESLGIAADIETRMLESGPARALALVWMAQENTNKSSPVGLLLTMLDRQQQPPDFLIHLAELALELGTTDRETAEREQRAQSTEAQASDDAQSGAASAPTAAPTGTDGLDERWHRGAKTIREVWPQIQVKADKRLLDRSARDAIKAAEPVSFVNGILTIRSPQAASLAPHCTALRMLARGENWPIVREVVIESGVSKQVA